MQSQMLEIPREHKESRRRPYKTLINRIINQKSRLKYLATDIDFYSRFQ